MLLNTPVGWVAYTSVQASGTTPEPTRAGTSPGAGIEEHSTDISEELCYVNETEVYESYTSSGRTYWILTD
jgi:hypothetical protein